MTEENLNDVVFDTMWKDKVTAHVEIKNNEVNVISYSDNAAENAFESYNPWEIVRKTHGFLWDDYMWIRFEGETLTWEDVNLGKL